MLVERFKQIEKEFFFISFRLFYVCFMFVLLLFFFFEQQKKACIVCPSSLVDNWGKEFDRWLPGQVKYLKIGESNQKSKVV